ncbi:SOS response-associated peptidase [Shewanella baltica]|uniref:SOS response-associated peptidase n=1 Tax=Shewanella baltica TaxID=62322 RepID=UPI003984FC48
MCGRISIDSFLANTVSLQLGVPFNPQTNLDLRPTEQVSVIMMADSKLQQLDCTWGIKTAWSKKLLINAQAETVREKKTFASAFASHRCVVPCSGWYEWREEGKKQKYLFSHDKGEPLYMAGIRYPNAEFTQLVTLTTEPIEKCKAYHGRMPLLISLFEIDFWLQTEAVMLEALLCHPKDIDIAIRAN